MFKLAAAGCALLIFGSLAGWSQAKGDEWISGNGRSCAQVCNDKRAVSIRDSVYSCAGLLGIDRIPRLRPGENFAAGGRAQICRVWGGDRFEDAGVYDCLCTDAFVPEPDPKVTLKQAIVGAWQVVSVTNEKDGTKTEPFGAKPQGYFIFTADGRFSTGIVRSGRPKFASNNRDTGTPEENKAAVQGTIATFGTYTVDEVHKSITVHIHGSSFPNWDGSIQARTVEIKGVQMTYTNPTSSIGGTAVVKLKLDF